MNKKITFLLLFCTSFIMMSQDKVKGNGVNTMVVTEINDFNKIVLNNEFEVTLIKSESTRVEIETDENLHEEIEINVADSILTIETSTRLRPKKKLDITVFCTGNIKDIELNDDSSITSLRTIDVAGLLLTINDKSKANLLIKSNYFKLINKNEAKMQLKSNSVLEIESPKVDLNLAESANSLITLRTDSLKVSLKKGALVELKGNANHAEIYSQNNTDIKGKEFNAKVVDVIARDNAKCELKAIEKIKLNLIDKAEVELYGEPKIELNKFRNSAKLLKKEEKKKK